jgi:hypothetical protein
MLQRQYFSKSRGDFQKVEEEIKWQLDRLKILLRETPEEKS